MIFKSYMIFLAYHVMRINLSCDSMNQSLSISYKPVCHIKLNPPSKPDVLTPDVNFTTVSWIPQVGKTGITLFHSELQWKQKDQPWSEENRKETQCDKICTAMLDEELLIKDETYEARIRVKTAQGSDYVSTWSDWSRTTSWVSPIGRVKTNNKPTPPPSDVPQGVLVTVGCMVAFALFLILFKTNKTTWIYIVKRIRGPPLPNPEKSFLQDINFQNFPDFTKESFHSFLKPLDIVSVEVTSTVDAVTPREQDDGPEGKEESDGRNGKEVDFQKLFGGSRGGFDKGSIQVCSDYERVQKLEVDSSELLSLDSCISSGGEEQVSQEESLEDVDKSTESTSLLFPPLNLISTTKSVEPSGDGYMPVRQDQS